MESIIYLVVTTVGVIVWLVRLEAKTNRNSEIIAEILEKFERHETKAEELHGQVIERLNSLKVIVGEIRGFLKMKKL